MYINTGGMKFAITWICLYVKPKIAYKQRKKYVRKDPTYSSYKKGSNHDELTINQRHNS